mgnify:CR=1 FL=1
MCKFSVAAVVSHLGLQLSAFRVLIGVALTIFVVSEVAAKPAVQQLSISSKSFAEKRKAMQAPRGGGENCWWQCGGVVSVSVYGCFGGVWL